MFVCHRCDNPRCVRPEHLFLGTPLDNTRDCVAKGRIARGERSGRARLSAAQVYEIRSRHLRGEPLRALGRAFGVDHKTIKRAVDGKTWSHL
jgi:hypothetical protein